MFSFAIFELPALSRAASKNCSQEVEMSLGQFALSQFPTVDTVQGSRDERGL